MPPILSLIIGVIVAMLTGGLFALLHAVLSITFKVDQIIGGTVINILAIGITGFLNRQMFFGTGSVFGGQIPHAPGVLPSIPIPLLSDIPVVGRIFEQQPITWAAIILVLVTHFVLFNTRWGLRTRAVGEHPRAADTVGINVYHMRYANVIIGGMLAGLAGGLFHPRIDLILRAADDQRAWLYCPGRHDLRQLDAVRRLGGGACFWCSPGLADQFAVLPGVDPAINGNPAELLRGRSGTLYSDHADPDRIDRQDHRHPLRMAQLREIGERYDRQ